MSFPLTIGSQVIQFPSTGQSPDWSQAVIQFANAVAIQLQTVSGPFDVAPSVQVLNNNSNTNITITGASFPSASVRSFIFTYAIYRLTDTPLSITETGTLSGIYNTQSSTWFLQDEYQGNRQADGSPWHVFDIINDNITLSTTALGSGIYDSVNSKISYSARAELVST